MALERKQTEHLRNKPQSDPRVPLKEVKERPSERLKRYLEVHIEQDADDFDFVSFDDEELTKFLRS